MQINFENINYLKSGNNTQRSAHSCLMKLNIFNELKEYKPILTGTIPIGINIKSSDLDIICNFKSKKEFINKVEILYEKKEAYKVKIKEISVSFSFNYENFIVEIRGEEKAVFKQNAYMHMISEYRLLKIANSEFKQKIIELKQKGIKTEPAFGKLLKLEDPYKELIKLAHSGDEKLIKLLNGYVEKS